MTRLKLRDDAYYAPTSDGICILTNSGQVVLTGPSIFQWIDRLAPYLDGRHTLAELTASMPAARREMTERVINALREQHVVVEAEKAEGPEHPLTDAEKQAYRQEIGFLGYFGPSAERSFRAYRDSTVVLVGAGRMLVATMAAALCSGSRRLHVVVTGECPTEPGLLAEYEQRARQRDPDQRITRTAMDLADEERLSEVMSGAAIVVHASDRAAVEQARTLDRVCGRIGIPFVSAVVAGDEAWLGPFGPVTGQRPGWMSGWRRLLALDGTDAGRPRRASAGQDAPAAPHPDPPAGSAPTVVANQFIREVVRLLSGTVEPSGQARMTRVDLRSLHTQRHNFLPHPFSRGASRPDQANLSATVDRLRRGERVDAEEFSRRVAVCLERRLGVLGEVTERDFTQLPLAVSQVQVSDPVLLLDPGQPLPVVTGGALSLADARRAAVLRGLAAYGSLMVDPRRLHVRGDTDDPRTGDPEQDLTALRARRWDGFIWGHGLADGLPHELPAAVAFPALRGAGSSCLPPAGAAAGYDWAEAVRHGLVAQCRQLTLTEVAECRRPFTPVDWTEVALDVRGDRYRSMVEIVGETLDVYEVTGSPGVPTLAFCLDGVTIAYASGFSFGEALCDGLAEVLLSYQAKASREADYAPVGVPPLPPRGRRSRVVACPAWSTDETSTAARLAELGWNAVAVPLDHDPEVTAGIMPYLVNVVLTRV